MEPVIVPVEAVAEATVKRLGVEAIRSGTLARELQPYIVQVPPKARQRLIDNGRAGFVRPDLRGDQFVVLSDLTLYRPEIGLVWEDADYLSVEGAII